MKKFFVLSLLILALAATAYSQPKLDFKASGFIDMKTEMWRWNLSTQVSSSQGIINVVNPVQKPNGGEFNRTAAYVDTRARLKFDAIMGKELSGTIFFEMDSRTWGDDPSGGAGQASGRNVIGFWSGDRSGVEIKDLYFDVAVPYIPIPITVRPGLQPFGVRPNMFMYVDGTGITAAAKIDPVTIIGMWTKALEGKLASSDDVDLYGLHVNAKVSTLTLGGYGMYFNMRQYPLNSSLNNTAYGSTADSMDARMWWLGAYADGKLGPVMLNFDFVYDKGDVKDRLHGFPKVKYSGWASRLKMDLPWEAFNFGIVGAYGSGADARKTSRFGLPNEKVVDPAFAAEGAVSSKVNSYVVPIASETSSFNEGEVLFASYINGGLTGWSYTNTTTTLGRGSVGGLWLAKIYGSYKVTSEYKVTLQGLYIGDTTRNGSTFGDSRTASGTLKDGSTIGWEVDLINEWQVYKNLSFKFGGGILFPGNALKFYDAVKGINEKPENPWILTTNLTYNF